MPPGPVEPRKSAAATRAPQRTLIVALLVVTASFVASSAYSQFLISGIHGDAVDISSTTAPSIELLVSMRLDVTQLSMELRAMSTQKKPVDVAIIHQRKDKLDRDSADYIAVAEPTDKDIEARIAAADRQFDAAVEHMEAALVTGQLGTAQHISEEELSPASLALSTAVLNAMTVASQEAAALAKKIELRRSSSLRITWGLDALCAITAVFAAVVVLRTLRSYREVLESRNALYARRADELETFASRVAHDIVNPLGTIKMGLELVRERTADPKLVPIVTRTLSSVERALAMVRDLLTFARAGTAPSAGAEADLAAAIASVNEELADEAKAAGITLVEPKVPACTVLCSPGILASILSNLVRNGIKYASSPPGHAGQRDVREIRIQGATKGTEVEVEVSDTGPGIPAAELPLIWLPYVRGGDAAARPGLGLGLATVKRLVEAHGGSVSVRSEPGRGTTFGFRLPLRADGPASDAAPAHVPPEPHHAQGA
ncbi:MAG: Tricarboxylate transport sensor protein TctE [Labilithrix sp.]|nr:Tricarboxylate transport sensor protein TctE [Labilithrix sp.]